MNTGKAHYRMSFWKLMISNLAIFLPLATTVWSVVPSPNVTGATYNDPYRVVDISTSDVWTVGFYQIPGGHKQTLIERYGS
jgi:hypothetical protein